MHIPLSRLVPNPYRDIENYELIEEKIQSLIASYEQTGYWGNIVCRKNGRVYEIAYGHHRLEALRRICRRAEKVDVIVRPLSNLAMIQIMASENLEEWGSSIWVEMETVRSTLQAYASGEIELPSMPAKTKGSAICNAPSVITDDHHPADDHPYTRSQIATVLGWVRSEGRLPDNKCQIAFLALEALERGVVTEQQLRGMGRTDAGVLCEKALQSYRQVIRNTPKPRMDAERDARRAGQQTSKELRKIHDAGGGKRELRNSTAGADIARQIAGGSGAPEVPNADEVVRKLCVQIDKLVADDGVGAKLTSLRLLKEAITPAQWRKVASSLTSLIRRTTKWQERAQRHAKEIKEPVGKSAG